MKTILQKNPHIFNKNSILGLKVYNLGARFDKSRYTIQGLVKPNINFLTLTKTLFKDTIQSGQKDFDIVMFNTLNIK